MIKVDWFGSPDWCGDWYDSPALTPKGESFIEEEFDFRGQIIPQYSIAYFCEGCGHIWGRAFIKDTKWVVQESPCPKHGGPKWKYTFWPEDRLNWYPLEVLKDIFMFEYKRNFK